MLRRREHVFLLAQIAQRAIFSITICTVALSVFSSSVTASELSVTPSLRLSYEQNDNIRMTLLPHDTVHGTTVAPRLEMGTQSETWGITGSAEAVRKRYSEEQDLDRDDEIFKLSSLYRTERSSFVINASRVNDAVISGEQEDPDLGLVSIQKLRRTENVQPTWSWSMSERVQLQLGYQLSEVSYTDGESVGLYDYKWRAATTSLTYQITPRSQFFITADYSIYRVPALSFGSQIPATPQPFSAILDVDSRTQSFKAGMGYIFSETMQGTLMLGQRKTSTERTVMDCFFTCSAPDLRVTHDSGVTFSGDLKKQFERHSIIATASRNIVASGAGTEVEQDILNMRVERPFTARLRGELAASGNKVRSIDDTASANRRQYSIQPNLSWRWTREADLTMAYRYSHLKREEEDQAVQSHAIYLTLAYIWPKFSVSR